MAVSVVATGFATAQYPDVLVIAGEEMPMHSNPLNGYLSKNPQRLPKSRVESSALWRGYIAYFEIAGGKLRVRDVKVEETDGDEFGKFKWVSVLDQVCPREADRNMDWFTGFLLLPQGAEKEYVHMGYESLFERYRLLLIKKGTVAADGVFTAEEYAEYNALQFKAYAQSEHFKKKKAAYEKKQKRDYFLTAKNVVSMVDGDFPMETLIDYKDFRPSKAP